MTTKLEPLSWPLTAEDRAKVYRNARIERARAMSALGRSTVALFKRMFRIGRPTTIWVPNVKGGRMTA